MENLQEKAQILEFLKLKLGVQTQTAGASYSCSLLSERWNSQNRNNQSGVSRGAITKLTGSGKTKFLVQFLAENPLLRVAWVEPEFTAYPCAVFQNEVDLRRILFIEAGKEWDWSLLQLLKSALFEVVVFHQSIPINEKILRRLQLVAKKSSSTLILLSNDRSRSWPVSLHLEVSRRGIGQGLIVEAPRY